MATNEASIIVAGVTLSYAQSMAVRVAVANMLWDLSDKKHMKDLGEIGPLYQKRLSEVQDLIIESINGPVT